MHTKIIEAGQAKGGPESFNWGKFLLGVLDVEWTHHSVMSPDGGLLLPQCGWGLDHLWVLDLQTGEGAYFKPGGSAKADLDKHRIWVCPMFEPFLEWLYEQPIRQKNGIVTVPQVQALPDFVELPDAPAAMSGYRRKGGG